MFFARPIWRKLQSVNGETCISKMAKVADLLQTARVNSSDDNRWGFHTPDQSSRKTSFHEKALTNDLDCGSRQLAERIPAPACSWRIVGILFGMQLHYVPWKRLIRGILFMGAFLEDEPFVGQPFPVDIVRHQLVLIFQSAAFGDIFLHQPGCLFEALLPVSGGMLFLLFENFIVFCHRHASFAWLVRTMRSFRLDSLSLLLPPGNRISSTWCVSRPISAVVILES